MIERKCIKIDQDVDSIDGVIFHDKDGNGIRLCDRLSDDSDLVEDFENAETYRIAREVVEELPNRDKEIIMLRFGFYDDKIYTQREIANKLNISPPYVSRIIKETVNKLGQILESKGVIELHSKRENVKAKVEPKKMRKVKTIYEYFNDYTREQINEMLMKLTEEERSLVTVRYGENLDNPVSTKLTKNQVNKFYGTLVPKMRRLLAKSKPTLVNSETLTIQSIIPEQLEEDLITKTSEPQERPATPTPNVCGEMAKEDYIKMLELLRTPTFMQIMGELSVKESVIISLKLGYIDGKYFSTKSIA